MNELKPCPFCGGKAYITTFDVFGGVHYAVCRNCKARVGKPSEADAVAAWNRRAQPANEPLTLDELRGMDGEPVWVIPIDGCGWDVIDDGEWNLLDKREYGCARDNWGREIPFDDYGKAWLAYRHKPTEESLATGN